jgi:pimeloyl-ACP methyl ester carboxylesterase
MRKIMRLWLVGIALLVGIAAPAAAQPVESGLIETTPGIGIYYEKYGSGRQVVLIPNRQFMPEMRALARPDRTLILYDMRNRGRSQPVEDIGQLTIIGDVEDVEALRQHFGAERVSLVGYSYLGLMVALYAVQHPDRVDRIVQIAPVPRRFGTAYPADQTADQSSLSSDGQAAARAWAAQSESSDESISAIQRCQLLHDFLSYYLVGNPDNHGRVPNVCEYENESVAAQERHLGAHFADIQRRDFAKDTFTSLNLPVLTIHGTLDRNAPYGSGLEWATTFPNGRLITVHGGAHQLWLDDPSIIADIDTFLNGQWPVRAIGFGRN